MKKVFFMALTALTLFSCSNDDVVDSKEKSDFSLSLKINQKTFTRGLQTPGVGGITNLKTMIIEVYDAAYVKLTEKSLSETEIQSVISNSELSDENRIIIPNIDSHATYVKIWAFQDDVDVASLPVLGESINTYQMPFKKIPFYPIEGVLGQSSTDSDGYISINKSQSPAPGPNASGNKLWTVEAKLAPYFARFEIKPMAGGITPQTNAGGTNNFFPDGTTIDITGIYMNNISDKKEEAVTLYSGNLGFWGNGDWAPGHPYTASGAWSQMYNASDNHQNATGLVFGADADSYNLFAQDGSPHVIVRVMVTLPDGSSMIASKGKQFYGFITIRDFNVNTGGKLSDLGVEASKIYKIALDLSVKLSDIHPDPETVAADLHADVTILDWTEVGLTPEL